MFVKTDIKVSAKQTKTLPDEGIRMNRTRLNRTGIPLLACITVFALFLICNALSGIFPCGSNTIVWCDMEQQAVPLLMQLKRQILSGEGIDYTLLDAGGMQFYGVFFFFLSNPLSFAVLLTDLPADRLVVLLVIIKLALSAGTAAYWLQSRIDGLPAAFQLLLAVMYGCSGYGLFYYQNLMWLDIMLMTPLLLCAIRHLLKTGKALPYAAVLSAMMILCFYLGYMVVLFILLYTALSVRFTVPKEKRGMTAAHFWGASILAACLTAFVWMPCLLQIMQSGRSDKLLRDLMQLNLFRHLADKICVLGTVCIGLAVLPLLWMPLRPCSGTLHRDRRLFLLLAAAALLDPVNRLWHGGSYQAFPLRWGMFPILLMLTLAGEQLAEQACIPDEKGRTVHPVLPVIGIGIAAAAEWIIRRIAGDDLHSYVTTLWVSTKHALCMLVWCFILTTLYICAIISYQQRRFSLRGCTGFLAVLFLLEFALNYDAYFGGAANSDELYAQTVSAAELVEPEEPTARTRLTRKYTHANMLGAAGYPTTAHYTSLTRADYLHGMKQFGYSSYWMEVPSIGGTLLSDAFWNIRYQLGTGADFPPWTETVRSAGVFSLGKSSLTLPSAFLTDAEPETIAALPDGSRFAVQKYLAKQYLDAEDAVIPYAPDGEIGLTLTESDGKTVCRLDDPETDGTVSYSLFLTEQQALYFDLFSERGTSLNDPNSDACDLRVNGLSIQKDYPENNRNGLVYLGTHEGQVIIRITVHKDFSCESFGVFGLQTERLAAAMQNAKGSALQYQNGVYTAECDTDSPQTMILSAAYDEGFSAEINGKAAPVYRVNSCQLAVRVPAGHSRVVLRFRVRGLRAGMLLGIAGLLATVLFALLRKRIPASLCKTAYRTGEGMLRLSYAVLLAAVYFLPLILCICSPLFV